MSIPDFRKPKMDPNFLFTSGECQQILDNVTGTMNGGELLSFEVLPELVAVGFLGEYFHLKLNYKESNSEAVQSVRLFVKSMLCQNIDASYHQEKLSILKKEANLYVLLLNDLRKFSSTNWCVDCYFVRKDLFVIQNLVDMGYATPADTSGFLGQGQMKSLLCAIAAMHACSIAYELKNNINIGEQFKDLLFEVSVSPTVDWYSTGVKAVLAVALGHPKYQSDEMQRFIREELPTELNRVFAMVNPSTKYRNVFCHRDLWAGNIFYHNERPDRVSAVVVDYQIARYSPAVIDVLNAVYLNTETQALRSVMSPEKMCSFYYEQFAAQLRMMRIDPDAHMSLLDLERSLQDFKLFGALIRCITGTILRVPGNYVSDMKKHRPTEYNRYANVDRNDEVLQMIKKHADFRDYMHDSIEEIMTIITAI